MTAIIKHWGTGLSSSFICVYIYITAFRFSSSVPVRTIRDRLHTLTSAPGPKIMKSEDLTEELHLNVFSLSWSRTSGSVRSLTRLQHQSESTPSTFAQRAAHGREAVWFCVAVSASVHLQMVGLPLVCHALWLAAAGSFLYKPDRHFYRKPHKTPEEELVRSWGGVTL